jgi:putative transposase
LEEGIPLAWVARDQGLVLRTAQRWVDRYRRQGLARLARKGRSDKDTPHFSAFLRISPHFSATLRQAIEGLALQRPHRFAAAIHRQAVTIAERLGESPPSYGFVYTLIRRLDPALMTLAHEGSKVYADTFDLVHRYESAGPNRVGCHGFVRSGGRGVNGNPTTRMS